MPRIARFFLFLSLSLVCLIADGCLLVEQVQGYNTSLSFFPPGTMIAGVPAGRLDAQAAGQRLAQAYTITPVELRIDGSSVHIDPVEAGQQLNLQSMLGTAAQRLSSRNYWPGFWDYLWARPPAPVEGDLACTVSADRLHAYLEQMLDGRYTQAAIPGGPLAPADVRFRSGVAGTTLDLSAAEPAIRTALCSLAPRVIELQSETVAAPKASLNDLNLLLHTLAYDPGFNGLVEVYFQDLSSGKEINFAYNQGLAVEPGIAFTAASTIKIPVMLSAFKRVEGPLPDDLRSKMELMIDISDNSSTDDVMKYVMDANIAPVQVTEDLEDLGFQNTFLAGFFYPGAPLLNLYRTPANQRADLSTDPDVYNQTTPADMGRLLADIQQCVVDNSGPLFNVFGALVTQEECQQMTDLLAKNRKGVLIESGLPEGVRMAHKYGWVTDSVDGLMHTASDAAIVYTPGGNFVLTIYLYDQNQLQWEPAQRIAARIATAIYNFYNTPSP